MMWQIPGIATWSQLIYLDLRCITKYCRPQTTLMMNRDFTNTPLNHSSQPENINAIVPVC